jgi:thioesterase domain-containing protein
LVAHPDVSQAIAAVASDAVGQPRLIAYVRTAKSPAGTLADDLSRHLRGWLPGYMVPNRIVVCTEFPLNNSGKVDRSALLRMADDTTPKAFAEPRTEVERTLTRSYADTLGLAQVGIDDGFFELGGSSLHAMQLVSRLATTLGVTVGVSDILLAPTPRLLATRIEGSHGPRTGGPLVTLAEGDQPIYLLHPIGGTVTAYLEMARELAGRHRVIGIEAVADAGAPQDHLPELVASYLELILRDQPHGPYRLAGWSMGGVLAYELARRLERMDAEVACLALLDAPFAVPAMDQSEAAVAAQFVADVAAIQGWDSGAAPGPGLPVADQLAWLAEQAAASTTSGNGLGAELERRFQIFRAHHRALSGYRPRGRIRASTVLIGAESSLNYDALPRWRELVDGPVSAHYLAGDHYSFLHGSGAGEIARLISGLVTTTAQPASHP